MNIVLYDDNAVWQDLMPFTATRPVSEIRIGIFTLREKWQKLLNAEVSYHCASYLSVRFPLKEQNEQVVISAHVHADAGLKMAVETLQTGQALYKEGLLIAFKGSVQGYENAGAHFKVEYTAEVLTVTKPWDIFQKNAKAIALDMAWHCGNRKSEPLSASVQVVGDRNLVYLEKGAKIEACILNTTGGAIYLGADSEVMEGSVIRGPFALCEHSALKLSTKVYGASTVGPHSKVGGELSNSVIFGYSNKAHDGFLGNSVIAEWCNLGADTNNSNLKNNYGNVKLYNYRQHKMVDTGLQFCGLMMGDHSKSGINTMFNTGTVVGVACNIYGGGFPATYVPDFSWGGAAGFEPYQLEKLVETATKMQERRGLKYSAAEHQILKHLFDQAQQNSYCSRLYAIVNFCFGLRLFWL